MRPAARFVALTSEFESTVTVRNGERVVDGKSILGMMTLAARHGAALELTIEGADEERMVRCMVKVLDADLEVVSTEQVQNPPCR